MPALIKITSSLKQDVTLLKLEGKENLSELFCFEVEMLSAAPGSIKQEKIIGKNFSLALEVSEGKKRYFSGIISRFGFGQVEEKFIYRAEIVPKLWLLKFKRNSRIFQQKSIKDIVTQILSEHDIQVSLKLNNTYKPLDYCVQYKETDFDFISRLLEKAGIFYLFKHADNEHTLILSDNIQCYEEGVTNAKTISLENSYTQLNSWEVNYHFFSGAAAFNDYDFINPQKKLIAQKKTLHPVSKNDKYEIYMHPGGYKTTEAGEVLSQMILEQQESQAVIGQGESHYAELAPGHKISFDNKQFPDEKGKSYVITGITYYLNLEKNNPSHRSMVYNNQFKAIPATTLFRPKPKFSKPLPSIQLATIVGPEGKEIYTDKYGRLKAQFVWDRLNHKDENSSCWMRAVQHWEGLLRIGTPVIIGFIDDDIDQPIILGPLHQGDWMPLYSPENDAEKSSLKRRCINKSDEKNYNEIRFNDKKDKQELFIYASKDMVINIENDYTQNVKKGNFILKVKGNVALETEGALSVNAQKSITLKSSEDVTLQGKNIHLQSNMAIVQQAGTKLSQEASEINHKASVQITTKASMQTIQADGILSLKGGLIKEN